jgi:hypothetical protein
MTDAPVSTISIEPPTGKKLDVYDVCIWLLRVLDRKEKSLLFAASVFDFYLKRGHLTERQSEALQDLFDRTIDRYERNALECQGLIAHDDGTATNVVSLSGARKGKRT